MNEDPITPNKRAMNRTNRWKSRIKEMGATIVGIADLCQYEASYLDSCLARFPRAISIGIRLPDEIIDEIYEGPTEAYSRVYEQVNKELDEITHRIKKDLKRKGFAAERILASNIEDERQLKGRFPHKTAAILSGVGWIGKNALLVTKEHGPRLRLATVFTDAPLKPDKPQRKSRCGTCEACVTACPADAIKGDLWEYGDERDTLLDPHKCEQHLKKHERELEHQICGICFAVCPFGRKDLEGN